MRNSDSVDRVDEEFDMYELDDADLAQVVGGSDLPTLIVGGSLGG